MVTATDRRTGPKDRRTTPDTVVDAVVEALHGLIEHPDPDVRVAVAHALIEVGRLTR